MTLRAPHGKAATLSPAPRVETLPVDELPAGVPAPARVESPTDRGESGRFARGNALAAEGGKARKGATRLAYRLGLGELAEDATFRPYQRAAVAFRQAQTSHLAATVGGGFCGPAPSSMVASAAL